MTLRAWLFPLLMLPMPCPAQMMLAVSLAPGSRISYRVELPGTDARRAVNVIAYASCGPRILDTLVSSLSSHTSRSRMYDFQFYVPKGQPAGTCTLQFLRAEDERGRLVAYYDLSPVTFNVTEP